MTAEVLYAPLTDRDFDELATVLHSEAVYEFIGGMPSAADFRLWLQRAIAGPPAEATGEYWINVVVRIAESGELIGRLEASIHGDLAEIAFLFNPRLWGRGYATRGLLWLHDHLRRYRSVEHLWATTHPENQRSSALLLRCGYVQASTQSLPLLYSYEKGDHVFCRSVV
ncbi:MAG: GNAT family N-acetyltransferase [Burkholderiales bacterium]|nr:GNAT family N-acetyltransferase [Burkholderiales bacterium]